MSWKASVSQAQVDAGNAYENLFVSSLFREWAPRMIEAARVQPGQRVLDVACGTGVVSREAVLKVGKEGSVVGLDANPGMLAVADSITPSIKWQQGIAESLPYPDESFDVVVCQFALMFFIDKAQALREMFRVLKSEGRLAVAVWDSLGTMPAYADVVALLEQFAGHEAADALRAPFVLGDLDSLAILFNTAGADSFSVDTKRGTAHFPSVRIMVEADLRGWLPVVGITLTEEQIARIIQKAEETLSSYVTKDGTVTFPTSAHIVSATTLSSRVGTTG